MIDRGSLSYLAFIRHTTTDSPSFIDMLTINLLRVPPNRDIDFVTDMELGTRSNFIPPYRTTPTKLKELKEKLKDLSSKGFISLVFPYGVL